VFTRDLRVRDNPALTAACEAGSVVPLFVLDESIMSTAAPNRIGFLGDSLRDLDRSLRERGGRLVLRRGRWIDEVMQVATQTAAGSIHLADDVSGLAQDRMNRLRHAAASARTQVHAHPGVTVVPPGDLHPAGGGEYKVFTPYHRRWASARWRSIVPAPERIHVPSIDLPGVELLDLVRSGPRSRDVVAGGEAEGWRRFDAFLANELGRYAERHDLLGGNATSRLSAFLHFGCVSPGEIASRLRDLPHGAALLRQLGWRDFFHQLLSARPDAAQADYRARGDRWNVDDEGLAAWCTGTTGYPLVDAAMRQLTDEGFMHNRARMVVASFLTKDLYVDWRLGAAHFMSLLVDGDVANNQLNWQWVAGTGSDTNPNRIFNPVLQGQRFDPDGEYIRRYLPELGGVRGDLVHWPDAVTRRRYGYPSPVVDHRVAIAAYRSRLRH
jgi:deoxyribodipyrimidine photo-lyase